jgi:hypothetical protein
MSMTGFFGGVNPVFTRPLATPPPAHAASGLLYWPRNREGVTCAAPAAPAAVVVLVILLVPAAALSRRLTSGLVGRCVSSGTKRHPFRRVRVGEGEAEEEEKVPEAWAEGPSMRWSSIPVCSFENLNLTS